MVILLRQHHAISNVLLANLHGFQFSRKSDVAVVTVLRYHATYISVINYKYDSNLTTRQYQPNFLLRSNCYFHSAVLRKTQAFDVLHSYNTKHNDGLSDVIVILINERVYSFKTSR